MPEFNEVQPNYAKSTSELDNINLKYAALKREYKRLEEKYHELFEITNNFYMYKEWTSMHKESIEKFIKIKYEDLNGI